VVDASDAALDVPEEPFDGLGVDVAAHVLAVAMDDALMADEPAAKTEWSYPFQSSVKMIDSGSTFA
jgi:hypothetical protein